MLCEVCKKRIPIKVGKGEGFIVYNGLAEIALENLSEPVDALITDPPYNSGSLNPRQILKDPVEKHTRSGNKKQYHSFYGDNIPERDWRRMLLEVFGKTRRILKPGGLFAIFVDWRRLGDMLGILLKAGLIPRGVLVWDKGRGARPLKGGFRNQTAFILWGRTPGAKPPDVYLDGVVSVSTLSANKVHPTEKPVKLMEFILQATNEGDTVLDPFMGSG
ncbi:MAG: site-specific DNA-methyltransferase, partial [Aquificota bacterium]